MARPDTEEPRPATCPRCAHRPHRAGECQARYRVTFEPDEKGDPCHCVTAGEPERCDRIINNGMGEPTECGRLLPCDVHGPVGEG